MHGNILTQIDNTLERALRRVCLIPHGRRRSLSPEPGRCEVGPLLQSGATLPRARRPKHTEDLPFSAPYLVRHTEPHSPVFHGPLITLPQEDQC